MCTTLAVRLMSGEGCVNFDRHVCLCLLATLPASSVPVFFKVCKGQQFCLQRQLCLSFLIRCISLPLKWIFVKCTGRNRQSGPYKELSHLTLD